MSKKLITPNKLRQNIANIQDNAMKRKYIAVIGYGLALKLYKYGQMSDRSPRQQNTYNKLCELNKIIKSYA